MTVQQSLRHTAFEALPLGSVKPSGWLKDQLRIQADGLTGHLEEHWEDVGPENGWIGGSGESWERGPYYLDGLLPLAHLLEDEVLIAKANRWVEWSLSSQKPDGSFGPERIKTVNNDIDKGHDWWHFMIMLKVLIQHEEATGDTRIIPFLTRFFRYVSVTIDRMPLKDWAEARGAEMLLAIHWTYKRTKEEFLLGLAEKVAEQTMDWTGILHDFPFWRKVEHWDHRTHVVNVAMGVKTPAIRYDLTGDPKEEDAVRRGIRSLMTYHGQSHGMFSGDEWLSGTHPSQGVELCAVVEYMFTMEHLVRVFGDGQYGDILEKVAFNALPAAISADWTSHQYDQQVNQIICNVAKRNWSNNDEANLFGLEPNFGCCTANMHQGWPKFAAHLWMSDGNGGLSAISYAPCIVKAKVGDGDGTLATLEVSGGYPFRESVSMKLALGQTKRFALHLRVPEWCSDAALLVNGESIELHANKGYAKVERDWSDGDTLELKLPMETRTIQRNLYAVSVERGPLVYVHPIGETWQLHVKRERFSDWEIYPTTSWRYGLLNGAGFSVELADIPKQPFLANQAPVRLRTTGSLVRNWRMDGNNADSPPLRADTREQEEQELVLVPYGSAKLRIGEFPNIQKR
ncbi:beta-L-arabinofuranosidase domain-containing protein [Paenibacillus sp. LHD-38]|uniref:beta-L-arabinofuranosidase domain-containing protein n=1 Tax=Paenibacillus sp. LHD-38 TaxID=3072143 RepID=UPI00280EC97E|nr:beta-L-arabinofuranosidase domain-containing protein [Paenibacillus sp. LHD-38]MDQ8736343.1 glycoside hydrolase family 127 protein [Paenibacillus sp. LHD-38]